MTLPIYFLLRDIQEDAKAITLHERNHSLTYLRGLEVAELTVEDMPMV